MDKIAAPASLYQLGRHKILHLVCVLFHFLDFIFHIKRSGVWGTDRPRLNDQTHAMVDYKPFFFPKRLWEVLDKLEALNLMEWTKYLSSCEDIYLTSFFFYFIRLKCVYMNIFQVRHAQGVHNLESEKSRDPLTSFEFLDAELSSLGCQQVIIHSLISSISIN